MTFIDLLSSNELTLGHRNGGQFEFLDVIASTPGVSLSTILRVGAHVDLQLDNDVVRTICEFSDFAFGKGCGVGLETSIYANIAEVVTNVTVANEDGCELAVGQEYSMALGAKAGATAHVGDLSVGPSGERKTVIWATTMDSKCGISSEIPTLIASATSSAYVERREATATSVVTMKTETSGANSTFDVTSFGTSATAFPTISGSPTPYTPMGSALEQRSQNQDWRLIVGLSVGLGVPFLAAVVFGALL